MNSPLSQQQARELLELDLKSGVVQRAYSVIQIKSIDEDERVIEGVASTPTPDRADDIVESEGAEYELPIPLLWQHNAGNPVGHVFEAKVSKDGIKVKARFAKVAEPASLKDELDRAWAMVKAKLVRGLSIGFIPLEWADIKGSFGVRYTKWSFVELSAVTIPMNTEANITSIKQIDIEQRAASGRKAESVPVLKTSPGVSGKSVYLSKGNSVKTTREQIEGFEATLAATQQKRDSIMEKSAEAGRTLDAAEKEEYETAQTEIKELSEHIERLKSLEKEQLTKAQALPKDAATDPQRGTESRQNSGIISLRPNVEKGIAFARFVKSLALANGNPMHALAIAESRKQWMDQTPIVAQCLKAAVGAGTSSASAWADDLVYNQNLTGDFIEYLRPATIIGQIPGLRRVPFNVRVGSISSGGTAYWVGQGAAIPLSKIQTDQLTLERTKAAGLMSITQELALDSSPSAEMLVRDDLRDTIAAFLDARFVNPSWAAVANVSPASITNGVTPITPSGTTAAALRTDIASLFAGFISNNINTAGGVWIMTGTSALAVSMMTNSLGQQEFNTITPSGGTFMGYPVVVSQSSNVSGSPTIGNLIIFAIPREIMLADEGGVDIEVSNQASLEMDDAPANNAASGTGAQLVSMFQTNSIAIRAIRYINWKKRRTGVVQFIQNALYAA